MSDHEKSAHLDLHPGGGGGNALRYIPYFLVILVLYVLLTITGVSLKTVYGSGDYTITMGELLLIIAAILSLAEQLKVSHPGIDNTMEALTMIGMGVVQLVLFVLGAAGIKYCLTFAKSDFLVLTFISLAAAIVAILINARTLRRTIGVGDN